MKIAIIGANGFLGEKLKEYFSKNNEVIPLGIIPQEGIIRLDATNKEEVDNFMLKFKPDVVIDTVALTSSVACETNPELCYKLNYTTAKNIADSCKKINAKMIFISSSYVFDGKKGDYSEEDLPNPENEYAKTKILAEREISKLKDYLIIRMEMMFGIYNNHLRFGTGGFDKEIIEVGYPEQWRNPIFINDVPKIMDELIKRKQKGIFHLAGRDKIKLLPFLEKLSKIENSKCKFKIVDPSSWLVKSPESPTLDISKINSLGIKTTSFEEALKEIKNQLNY